MTLKLNIKLATLMIGVCGFVLPASATIVPELSIVAPSSSLGILFESDGRTTGVLVARSKPRIPGGSGCDDPGDILEHPECRVNMVNNQNSGGHGNGHHHHVDHHLNNVGHSHNGGGHNHNGGAHVHTSNQGQIVPNASGSGRDAPRIPGGSGCDDPNDILEHPECTISMGSQ